jgi:hypothetical protein
VDGKETVMRRTVLILLVTAAATMALAVACGGDDEEGGAATGTPRATTSAATGTPRAATATTVAPTTQAGAAEISDIVFSAAPATITVDGSDSDWANVKGVTVPMKQIDVDELDPAQVQDMDIDIGPLPPVDATLKVAVDEKNIYVLMEVPDGFDYNPDPAQHNFSPSIAVMFRIDESAPAHMGVEEGDLKTSLGVVDIWHWELDCGLGQMAGGGGIAGGDDPKCNLDDEYAPNPEDREDDGGGDVPNASAENSLSGVWKHTAADSGAGAQGVWVFEMSRPLQTGDSQDAQFASGEKAYMALAYFDPNETVEGWTDAGHLQSADSGWIEVALP